MSLGQEVKTPSTYFLEFVFIYVCFIEQAKKTLSKDIRDRIGKWVIVLKVLARKMLLFYLLFRCPMVKFGVAWSTQTFDQTEISCTFPKKPIF